MEPHSRLGPFFLLVGLVLLILFVGSAMSRSANALFLLAAVVSLALAYVARPRKESQDSGRFGSIRKMSQRSRERRDEQKNKNPKK
ncbi:MAG TPA: hypothetical protein VMC09_04280 [Anaerolineales bacterium]|nr:hypothetical protein [Anaerolineales bacterium]